MGIFQDIWNGIYNVLRGIVNGVGGIFRNAGAALQNAFTYISNVVRSAVNWAWQGLQNLYKGILAGISGLQAILQRVYSWFLEQLRFIYNKLMELLRWLFEVTESKIMQYARWQAKIQLQLEKEILASWS